MQIENSATRVDNTFAPKAMHTPSSTGNAASFQSALSSAVGNTQAPQPNSIWAPTKGKWIEPAEVKQYLATNPTDRDILAKAAELGLSEQDLNTALRGQGYSGVALGQHFNRLSFNLYNGGLGYSAVNAGFFAEKIVSGGGHSLQDNGNGGLSWKYGTASATVFTTVGLVVGGNMPQEPKWNENNQRVVNGSV